MLKFKVIVLAMVALAACSSDSGTDTTDTAASTPPVTSSPTGSTTGSPTVSTSCQPSGASLQLAAKNIQFDKNCLAAPANTAVTIAFDNQDSAIPHNVAIFREDPTTNPSAEPLFRGENVTGPATQNYNVDALAAGTYYFRCDVHPVQMVGGYVVA